MDWFVSFCGILSMWLIGNKSKSGWIIKIISQIAWIYLAIVKDLYGFIPLASIAMVIATRNYFKWRKDEKKATHLT